VLETMINMESNKSGSRK